MEKRFISKDNYQIINAIMESINSNRSFLLEAGAGSGKTATLINIAETLEVKKLKEYTKANKRIACITYTNAAVDVINNRLSENSFVRATTIHSFCWDLIKFFQNNLLLLSKELDLDKDLDKDYTEISYTLGVRYIENNVLYINHNDVLSLFARAMKDIGFRKILSSIYPIILIDEYQDTNKEIVDAFFNFFINKNEGPVFGFFGDSWQAIYRSLGGCGEIKKDNLNVITKTNNYRSSKVIVEVINKIRTDLQQVSCSDNQEGEAVFIHNNDFSGKRLKGYYAGELPDDEYKCRLKNIEDKIKSFYPNETVKTLFLTHKLISRKNGYITLNDIIKKNSPFSRYEDEPIFSYFLNYVEPFYNCHGHLGLLSNVVDFKDAKINTSLDLMSFYRMLDELEEARSKKIKDVVSFAFKYGILKRFPLTNEIKTLYENFLADNNFSSHGIPLKDYFEVDYIEIIRAVEDNAINSRISTQHNSKGEEWDNVIFVISRGWSDYTFEHYVPFDKVGLDDPKYFDCRNLFYVSATRAKKRLFFVLTYDNFVIKNYLSSLVEAEFIYSYSEFMRKDKNG